MGLCLLAAIDFFLAKRAGLRKNDIALKKLIRKCIGYRRHIPDIIDCDRALRIFAFANRDADMALPLNGNKDIGLTLWTRSPGLQLKIRHQ